MAPNQGYQIHDAEVFDTLASLADRSLVTTEEHNGATRYRLLETVRQYSTDRLAESGEADAWRDRHLAHFLAYVEEAEPHLVGREEQAWQDRLEIEHDNLRFALEWATEEGRDPESGLRMCGALHYFWLGRGYFKEGRTWCRTALERASGCENSAARAATLRSAGGLAYAQGDYGGARPPIEESLTIWRQLGNPTGIAQALNGLGIIACDQGDYVAARSLHEQSLEIRRELGDSWTTSQSLCNLGVVEAAIGDYDSARPLLEESLSIRRTMGVQRGTGIVLHSLSKVAFLEGDCVRARTLLEESLSIRREVGDLSRVAESLMGLGNIACELGDCVAARSLYEESLTIWRALHVQEGLALLLDSFAELAMAEAEILLAARLWGAAASLREEIGGSLWLGEQTRHRSKVAAARAILDDDARFDALWNEGRAMGLEEAVEHARKG